MPILVLVMIDSARKAGLFPNAIIQTTRGSNYDLKYNKPFIERSAMRTRHIFAIVCIMSIFYTLVTVYSQPGEKQYENQLRQKCCITGPMGERMRNYCENGIASATKQVPMSIESFCTSK